MSQQNPDQQASAAQRPTQQPHSPEVLNDSFSWQLERNLTVLQMLPPELMDMFTVVPLHYDNKSRTLECAALNPRNQDMQLALQNHRSTSLSEVVDQFSFPKRCDRSFSLCALRLAYPKYTPISFDRPQQNRETPSILERVKHDRKAALPDVQAPIVMDDLLADAFARRASDIHIEPEKSGGASIRLRIDGRLIDYTNPMLPSSTLNPDLYKRCVAYLQNKANLDMTKGMRTQDGAFSFLAPSGTPLDVRINTAPVQTRQRGETNPAVVMRILPATLDFNIRKLGMPEEIEKRYLAVLNQPQGMMLITGPTGSGKTTTLYTGLDIIARPRNRSITTIEDPVEILLENVNQIQCHALQNITFATALRATMRRDPDVILVGEIRDGETLNTAIAASLTGHLVFGTLHTNDAPSTISRMVHMGGESYLIADTLSAIMAQRLVPRCCTECMAAKEIQLKDLAEFGIGDRDPYEKITVVNGTGMTRNNHTCEACLGTGVRGRIGVYELLEISDEVRDLIRESTEKRVPTEEIRRAAAVQGMRTLQNEALRLIESNIVSPEAARQSVWGH